MGSDNHTSRRYIVTLACISLALLVLGSVFRPRRTVKRAAETTPQLTLLQSEIERLKRSAQQNQIAARPPAQEFAHAAEIAGQHLMRLPALRRSGIAWGAQHMLVTAKPENTPVVTLAVRAGQASFSIGPALWSAGVPLGAAWLPASAPASVTVTPLEQMATGTWLVGVALRENGTALFEPGRYGGSATESCAGYPIHAVLSAVPLSPALLGGGLFDLRGNLVAAIAACGDRIVAIAVEDIVLAIDNLNRPASQILNRYGVDLRDLGDDEKKFFGVAKGVLVQTIWRGWPAADAGLLPGDIVTAIDAADVSTTAALPPPDSEHPWKVSIVRRGRARRLTVAAAADSGTGILLQSDGGVVIKSVDPDSPAARSGLRAGDRILSIDYRPTLSGALVHRQLAAAKRASLLLISRGDSLTTALVQP